MVSGFPLSLTNSDAFRAYIRGRIRREAPLRAYEEMAPAYDAFTAHDDHEAWARELLPHLERHGLAGRRLLDIGCGTGKSLIPMLDRGWRVCGYDLSPKMLALARKKTGEDTELYVADVRELPVFGYFDLVWSVNDVLGYLLDRWELAAALRGMRHNLAIGGLLAFDLNTLLSFRTFFASQFVIERDGPDLIWRGEARVDQPPGSVCEALFEIEGRGTNYGMAHRQRHFPEVVVRSCIAEAGLECLDVFGQDQDGCLVQPLDESKHRKAVYIARDEESAWGRFSEGSRAVGSPRG